MSGVPVTAWPPPRPGQLTFISTVGPADDFTVVQGFGKRRVRQRSNQPVPYDPAIRNWRAAEFMVSDQRFAAHRPDVLVYQTPPSDRPMTIVGPLEVHLSVSTTGTDCDWVVKTYRCSFRILPATPTNRSPEFRMSGYQMLLPGRRDALTFSERIRPSTPMVAREADRHCLHHAGHQPLHSSRSSD